MVWHQEDTCGPHAHVSLCGVQPLVLRILTCATADSQWFGPATPRRPLLATATGQPYPELKKEKWAAGATVKDRCEPCHIVHVLQVLCGARSERGLGDAAAEEDQAEEARVAEAAYANSMRMFWPRA